MLVIHLAHYYYVVFYQKLEGLKKFIKKFSIYHFKKKMKVDYSCYATIFMRNHLHRLTEDVLYIFPAVVSKCIERLR